MTMMCFPYGAVILTIVYGVFCYAILLLGPDCPEGCRTEGVDNSPISWSSDLFTAAVFLFLGWHVLRYRQGLCKGFVAFVALALAHLLWGVVGRNFGNDGTKDGKGTRGYFVLNMLAYLMATDCQMEVAGIVARLYPRISPYYRPCLVTKWVLRTLELMVVLAFLGIFVGSMWCAASTDVLVSTTLDQYPNDIDLEVPLCVQMVDVGQVIFTACNALFWIGVACIFGAFAKMQAEEEDIWYWVWGLPVPLAAASIVIFQTVVFVFHLMAFSLTTTTDEQAEDDVATAASIAYHYCVLMTGYFAHNLVATMALPWERKNRWSLWKNPEDENGDYFSDDEAYPALNAIVRNVKIIPSVAVAPDSYNNNTNNSYNNNTTKDYDDYPTDTSDQMSEDQIAELDAIEGFYHPSIIASKEEPRRVTLAASSTYRSADSAAITEPRSNLTATAHATKKAPPRDESVVRRSWPKYLQVATIKAPPTDPLSDMEQGHSSTQTRQHSNSKLAVAESSDEIPIVELSPSSVVQSSPFCWATSLFYTGGDNDDDKETSKVSTEPRRDLASLAESVASKSSSLLEQGRALFTRGNNGASNQSQAPSGGSNANSSNQSTARSRDRSSSNSNSNSNRSNQSVQSKALSARSNSDSSRILQSNQKHDSSNSTIAEIKGEVEEQQGKVIILGVDTLRADDCSTASGNSTLSTKEQTHAQDTLMRSDRKNHGSTSSHSASRHSTKQPPMQTGTPSNYKWERIGFVESQGILAADTMELDADKSISSNKGPVTGNSTFTVTDHSQQTPSTGSKSSSAKKHPLGTASPDTPVSLTHTTESPKYTWERIGSVANQGILAAETVELDADDDNDDIGLDTNKSAHSATNSTNAPTGSPSTSSQSSNSNSKQMESSTPSSSPVPLFSSMWWQSSSSNNQGTMDDGQEKEVQNENEGEKVHTSVPLVGWWDRVVSDMMGSTPEVSTTLPSNNKMIKILSSLDQGETNHHPSTSLLSGPVTVRDDDCESRTSDMVTPREPVSC